MVSKHEMKGEKNTRGHIEAKRELESVVLAL
jgi:hypothetical protein